MELSKSVIKQLREENPGKKELVLCGQTISSIAPDSFEDDTDLDSIDLSNNEIKKIDEKVFSRLTSLKYLNLNGNGTTKLSITYFPPSLVPLNLGNAELITADYFFKSLVNLEHLNLKDAKISRLTPHLFAGLANLKVLNLASCQLHMYRETVLNDLKNLVELDISGNSFTGRRNFFTGLNNLKILKAARCSIGISNTLDLSPLTSLTSLDLRQNKIKNFFVEVTLHDPSKLESLDLSDNGNLVVQPHSFSKLTGLKKLDLTDCRIRSLETDALQGLDKLEELKFVFSLFNRVSGKEQSATENDKENKPKEPFSFEKLLKKSIDKSKDTTITQDAFANLKSLRILDVSQGKIDFLDSNLLACLSNLEELHMKALGKKHKPVTVTLRKDTFKPLTKLRVLCLTRNDIVIADNDCFAPLSNSLEKLELKKLRILSNKEFDLLKDLKKLNTLCTQQIVFESAFFNYDHLLKSSNIKSITVRLEQRNLIRFRAMIAAKGVPLTKDVDDFNYSDLSEYMVKNMRNLTELELSECNLNSLNEGIFDHLKQLVKLNLSKNYLPEIPAKTFDHLGELEELNLSNNKIDWLDFNRVFKYLDKLTYLSVWNNKIVECNIDETCNLKRLKKFFLYSIDNNDVNLILVRKMFSKKNKTNIQDAEKIEDMNLIFDKLEERFAKLDTALESCKETVSIKLDSVAESLSKLDVDFFQDKFNQERLKMIAKIKKTMNETIGNINVLTDAFKHLVGDWGLKLREHIMQYINFTSQMSFLSGEQDLENLSHYVEFKWKNRFDNLKAIRYYELAPSLQKYKGHYMPFDGLDIQAQLPEIYQTPDDVTEPADEDEDREDDYWPNEYLSNKIELKIRSGSNSKAVPRILELKGDFRKVHTSMYRFYTYGHYLLAFYEFEYDYDLTLMYIFKKRWRDLEIEDHPTGDVPIKYLKNVVLIDVYDRRAGLKQVAKATKGFFFSKFCVHDLNEYGILVENRRLDKERSETIKVCSGECKLCDDRSKLTYSLYDFNLKCKNRLIRIPTDDKNAAVIKFTDELFYLYSKSKNSGEALIQMFNYKTQTRIKQFELYPEMGSNLVSPIIDLDNNFISISNLGRIKCYNLDTGESSCSTLVTDGRSMQRLRITHDGSLMVVLSMHAPNQENVLLER